MRDGWGEPPPTSPRRTVQKLRVFEQHYTTKGLLHSDPPDHTRLRRFTAKRVLTEQDRGHQAKYRKGHRVVAR